MNLTKSISVRHPLDIVKRGKLQEDGSIKYKGKIYKWKPRVSKRFFVVGIFLSEQDLCCDCEKKFANYMVEDRQSGFCGCELLCSDCIDQKEKRIKKRIDWM